MKQFGAKPSDNLQSKNRSVGMKLAGGVFVMLALAFISVPLYNLYCKKTGYGGATQVAAAPLQDGILDRKIKIRFNADVAPGLLWSFKPAINEIEVRIGEAQKIIYEARSQSKTNDIGVAVYNVQPDRAGLYFNKVQCFCFDEKPLKAGETAELPVQFFVDPALASDRQMDDVKTITLSYTFFAAKSPTLAQAQKKFDIKQTQLLETAKNIP
ncbi:MAG: cytochrome c oxidase assembly protein [Alphaproteobacteria bacterium]|nr:cytochrome c oxidase assembly protein [Alphaproteobacteria bacterium]